MKMILIGLLREVILAHASPRILKVTLMTMMLITIILIMI